MEDAKTRLEFIRFKGETVKREASDYIDILQGTQPSAKRLHSIIPFLGKVLVKGRIGQGKSMLAKKIAFDWGQGLFKIFPLVFFIDMKLAQPGQTIENMIIEQNGLGELKFTPQKITEILDTFGGEILVIIDSVCDQTVKSNDNVFAIIKNANLSFHLMLTLSESNYAENVDQYFETVCKVQGFNGSDVKSVMAKLGDSHREVASSWIQSLHEGFSGSEYRNPMLVLLLSFLASYHPSTDLGQNLSIFTVYARTVLRLLDSVDFESQRNLVKDVGKIAFDVLQSGKVYTETEVSDLNKLVKGLLVDSKTTLVSFTHSSLQMFLASLYLVLELDQGISMETLLGKNCLKPVFMINSLFLYFCLSLLGENPFVKLKNVQNVHLELKNYVLGRINSVQLDLQSIAKVYPALNMSMANIKNDRLSLHFLLDVLSECTKVEDLILTPCPGLPVEEIFSAMQEQCKTMQSFRLLDDDEEIHVNITNEFCPDDFRVVIHNQGEEYVRKVFQLLETLDRSCCIYLIAGNKSKPMIDISLFPRNAQKLYLMSRKGGMNPCTDLTAREGIPQLQNLTHLTIPDSKLCIGDQVIEAFSDALEKGRFSSLAHLVLRASSLSGKFSKLLKSGMPHLTRSQFPNQLICKGGRGLLEEVVATFRICCCWQQILFI